MNDDYADVHDLAARRTHRRDESPGTRRTDDTAGPSRPAFGPEHGAILRQARERVGLTVTELADRVEATPSTVYALQLGRSAPSVAMAEALADAADMTDQERTVWVAPARPGVGRSHPTGRRHVTRVPPPKPLELSPAIGRLIDLLTLHPVIYDTKDGRRLLARLEAVIRVIELRIVGG